MRGTNFERSKHKNEVKEACFALFVSFTPLLLNATHSFPSKSWVLDEQEIPVGDCMGLEITPGKCCQNMALFLLALHFTGCF